MDKILRFRQKPTELRQQNNPYMPSQKTIQGFRLPPKLKIQDVAAQAETIDIATLGIVIPHCKYPERFEAGIRYGLAHNLRTDVKTQFRPLFSSGFCWAKMFYRKFAPNHPLAASGSYKMKLDLHGQMIKLKDI
jgi:hypothetical protein